MAGSLEGDGAEIDPAALLDEVFGLRPGERLAVPTPAPRPGWSRPLLHLAWSWLDGWARAQDGGVARRTVCCVPVWQAVAGEEVEVACRLGLLAVDAAGIVSFVQEPKVQLDGVAIVTADVTLAVVVVWGARLDWGTPVARQLGPYAVVRKRVGLRMIGELELRWAALVDPPAARLEPWTQQVALAVPLEEVPEAWRRVVAEAVDALSDV